MRNSFVAVLALVAVTASTLMAGKICIDCWTEDYTDQNGVRTNPSCDGFDETIAGTGLKKIYTPVTWTRAGSDPSILETTLDTFTTHIVLDFYKATGGDDCGDPDAWDWTLTDSVSQDVYQCTVGACTCGSSL